MSEANFDLLDENLDELADLEGFEPIPAGTFRLVINFSNETINDKPAVKLDLKVLEVLELSDSSLDADSYIGKSNNIAYILKKNDGGPNKVAQGQLKEVLSVLKETFGGDTVRDVMENSNGAEVTGTLKVRVDKNDPTRRSNEVVAIVVE